MAKELKGVIAAVCTPMSADGERIEEAAFRRHLDAFLEAGTHTLLICGGTGEFNVLTADERRRLAEIAVRHVAGQAHVQVQTSAIRTTDAIEWAKHAEGIGADSLLVLPPYFEGPDLEGVYWHYARVAESVRLPMLAYNIPVWTGIDITPAFFRRLAEIPTIVGLKDSTGSLMRVQELLAQGANVFPGLDPLIPYCLMAGCRGVVWGGANAMPRECVRLYDLIEAGRHAEALALWERMRPANMFFWKYTYNAAVKAAANLAGFAVGPCRKPVMALNADQMAELKAAMRPLLGAG